MWIPGLFLLFPLASGLQTQNEDLGTIENLAPPPQQPIPFSHKVHARTQGKQRDWISVGGDRGHMRYSPLDQINRKNVDNLKVAWTYHTGELKGRRGKIIECTPIVIDGVMYITTAYLKVVALDAASGRQLWRFDPPPHPTVGDGKLARVASAGVNRGVAYWSDGREGESGASYTAPPTAACSLWMPGPASRIRASAKGVPWIFGRKSNGTSRVFDTGPPRLQPFTRTSSFSASRVTRVQARWHRAMCELSMSAQAGRSGASTPCRGRVSLATTPGKETRGRTVAAPMPGVVPVSMRSEAWSSSAWDRPHMTITAATEKDRTCLRIRWWRLMPGRGRRIWHFQTVHHDLWDHDLPVYPNLVQVTHGGKQIDAVAQVGKQGYVFLFDRVTGKPLFEIEERPVPPSDVPGEEAWPTQPIPVKPPPFARQDYGEDDLTNISKEAHDVALEKYRKVRAGSAFNPPSLEGTLVVPGFYGGAAWSGASFDPTTGILYVNSNNVLHVLTLVKAEPGKGYRYKRIPSPLFRDDEGYPANEPPWGVLTAIDLNQGEFRWQVPLGEYPELTARGIPPTGALNLGGTIVTAGGLVFIGATRDEKFHAFDKDTGQLLWEYSLPAGGYATPSTYMLDGCHFVVIAAGGAGYIGTPAGDSFLAFSLPSSTEVTER